ncbi:MAG: hypothetical protein QXU97_02365 [Fervidicoccaceae archaeon]
MTDRVLSRELVEYLSRLTLVELEPREVERLLSELEILISYINDVLSIDVSDSSELLYVGGSGELRDDEPEREELLEPLRNAEVEAGFVKAPKVVIED